MRRLALPLLVAAALAGCDSLDPYDRPGTWRPTGANDANLRAMLVEPDELFVGTAETGADGHLGAVAVERLRADRVRELPATRLVRIGAGGGGPGGQ
jgi:type IV pilus biogenesis protein CpaD/CtpE